MNQTYQSDAGMKLTTEQKLQIKQDFAAGKLNRGKTTIIIETMSKLILFFFLMSVSYSWTSSYQSIRSSDDFIFRIDFQDFFSRDSVELNLNACNIFADTLTSNKSDGLANMRINAFIKEGENYFIKFRGKSLECVLAKDNLNFVVILNGHQNKFKVDLSKGKYIGFSKKNEREVYLNQSMKAFEYD